MNEIDSAEIVSKIFVVPIFLVLLVIVQMMSISLVKKNEIHAEPMLKTLSKGDLLETNLFATILPNNWEVSDDRIETDGTISISNVDTHGSIAIILEFEEAKHKEFNLDEYALKISREKNGTEPERVIIGDTEYIQTSYSVSSSPVTVMVADKKDYTVTITIRGEEYRISRDIKQILNAMSYK